MERCYSEAFGRPHIIRLCPHGDHIYVGDITEGQSVIWKFKVYCSPCPVDLRDLSSLQIQKEGGTHEDAVTGGLFHNPFYGGSTSPSE